MNACSDCSATLINKGGHNCSVVAVLIIARAFYRMRKDYIRER